MKKQKMQLGILLAVLVLLGVGYLGLQKYYEFQSNKKVEKEGDPILSLKEEDILKFSYDSADRTYTYEKSGDTWYYTEDKELELYQTRLNYIAGNLAELNVLNTITDVADLEQYGLAEPTGKFSFETAEESYEFNIGGYNEMTFVYYIGRPEENTVYVVSESIIQAFEFDVMDIAVKKTEMSAEDNS